MKLKPLPVICSSVKPDIPINSDFVMNPRAATFCPILINNQPNIPGSTFSDVTQLQKFTLNPNASPYVPNPPTNLFDGIVSSLLSPLNNVNDCSPHNTNTYNSLGVGENNPLEILKTVRIKNPNRLIIAQLNINSIRNKFDSLQNIIKGYIDILVITESKIDSSFPVNQFEIGGYSHFRLDKSATSGGVIIYVREDIPCRKIREHSHELNIEGIFLEINLRKSKWLLFGGYNHDKSNIDIFLENLGHMLDKYMCKFEI